MKRIISTILTISMLFTMIPAFASDIETSDVNNIAQLFSVGNGEAVVKQSAAKAKAKTADFEEQEVGQLNIASGQTYNGTNFQLKSVPNGGTETYFIEEADGNKFVTLNNEAGGYTSNSSTIVKFAMIDANKVGLTYRFRFNESNEDWTTFNINSNAGVMSASFADNNSFGINYGGDYANNAAAAAKFKGAVNNMFKIETGVWYTLNYVFDFSNQTYDMSVTSDNGDVDVTLTTKDGSDPLKDIPFRATATATKADAVYVYAPHDSSKAANTSIGSFSLDSFYSYDALEVGLFFSLIGQETLSDDADLRIEYNNATGEDKDVCVTYVAMEDGIVADVDEDIVTLSVDNNVVPVDVSVDTSACTGEVTYSAFITNVETGGTLCTAGSKNGTIAPENFVTVAESNGQIIVSVAKDSAYDAAIIRIYDEDDNLVGIKEQKVTNASVSFNVKNYNEEYKADVTLTDAEGKCAYAEDGIIVWNPTIAEDFNVDPETAFATHMDALNKAYEGFEDIYNADAEYINNYIMMRNDYTSVHDVVETVLSIGGFLEIKGAENETEFALAFETHADSFGIVLDDLYYENKDAIISKLFADKENEVFILPEELVEVYNEVYIVIEFNVASAISYSKLFNKYATVLGIAVDSTYEAGEATINELIYQYKEDNGGSFADIADIVAAFKDAKNNAVDPVGYSTIATSPVSKNEFVIDFEDCDLVTGATAATGMPFKFTSVGEGNYDIVEENGGKHVVVRQAQNTGTSNTNILFDISRVKGENVNVEYQIRFDKQSSNWTMLNLGDISSLYVNGKKFALNETYKVGNQNLGATRTISSETLEGEWYTVRYALDFVNQTYNITITDENGTEIANVDTKPRFWATKQYTETPNLQLYTSQNEDGEYQVSYDNIRAYSEPTPAVYYSAKSSESVVAGLNSIAVDIENLTGADRSINVYVPVYIDGVLYTVAANEGYFANGASDELIVDYVLPEGVDVSDVKYSVIVADSFDGVNHSVKSDTAAGTLSVDATADYENDVINVTADSTFDNGTIIVLAPGATLANATPADILYYATGKTAAVKVADGIKGDLKVYAVAQDADYNVTVANDTVYYPGNGVADELVAAFSDVTEDNIAAVVADYMAVINAIEPGMATFYAENAVAVDAALVANKPYETVDQIIKTIKSVEVLKALVAAATEAEFETAFNEFAVMFEVELDAIYEANEDKFIADLYAAKDTFNTYEDVMNAFADIYLVCGINNANENTIGSLLTGFADVLGITIDDVYTTKQAYIDRLVAADMPFADKAAIISSYNSAYAKAEELEGDFTKKVVSQTAGYEIIEDVYTFEDEAITNGDEAYSGNGFTIASANLGGTYYIEHKNNNKYVRLTAPGTTKRALELKIPGKDYGKNVEISTLVKLNKLSNWILLYVGSNASCLNIQNGKFVENWGNVKAPELGSKSITTGIWYKVTWKFDVEAKTYDLYIVNNEDASDVVVDKKDVKCRNQDITAANVSTINFTTSSENSTESDVQFDDITRKSIVESGTYYTVTGTTTLLPGENVFTAEITNADAVDRIYKAFVPVYADGKLVSIDKEEITVLAKSDKTEDIEFTAPMTGKTDYKIFLVDSLNGVNYGISSKVEGQATTTPAAPVADYTARAIKVSGETTYDNMTVIVTAPTANSNVYDIDTANANPDVIAYYDNIELKKVNEVNTFAADIKIPDRFVDGDYYVYFVSQNKDGQAVTFRKTVYYAGSAKLDDMLADFNAVTDANVETTINTYMDVLLGVASDMDAFYTANKAAVNEAVIAGKPYANVGAVNNTIFAIYAADKLKNVTDVDTFKSTLEYYASVFGIDVTSAEYIAGAAEINNRLFSDRANITKLNLADKFANALMLSEFNNATRETAPAVLDKYASKLGIAVNAAYIDSIAKTIAADGVVFNSAQDVVDAYNAGISLGESSGTGSAPTPSTPVGGLGGGGGAGGGGGGGATTDKVYFDKPYVEAEKTVDGGSATAAFNDLDSVSWAVEAITELKKIGVINGVSETEFAPNREVTREEFAKMIVNAFSITGEGKSFADVPATAWYAPYVTALASSGIVNGVSETKFGVGTKITRQDAAVILDRTALNTGIEFEHRYSASVNFKDYIADYAFDSVLRLYQNGVINGTSEGIFSATATLTRAQAAKMIYSLMQLK